MLENLTQKVSSATSYVGRSYSKLKDYILASEIKIMNLAEPGYSFATANQNGNVNFSQIANREQANSNSIDNVVETNNQQEPKKRKPHYFLSSGIGAVVGGVVGALIHPGSASLVSRGQAIAGGAVLGAITGLVREISKVNKKIRPAYYGLIIGCTYGLASGGLHSLIATQPPIIHNLYTSVIYFLIEDIPGMRYLLGTFFYPGLGTTSIFSEIDCTRIGNITNYIIENMGAWAMIGAGIGAIIPVKSKITKLAEILGEQKK